MGSEFPAGVTAEVRQRWKILVAATLLQLVAAVVTQGIGAWGLYLQSRLSLRPTGLGLLGSLAWGVSIPGLAVAGRLLDQAGERILLVSGCALMATGVGMLALAHDIRWAGFAMVLLGCGYSPVQPGGSKVVHLWFPPHERGFAMGMRQAALPLGGALAAFAFPLLLQSWGWHLALFFVAGMLLGAGAVFAWVYPASVERRVVGSEVQGQRVGTQTTSATPISTIMTLGVALVAAQTGLTMFWASFLTGAQRMPLDQAMSQLMQMQLFGALGRLLLAAWSDRMGGQRAGCVYVAATSNALLLGVAATLPEGTSRLTLSALSCALGFVAYGWYGPWVVWLGESASPGREGLMLGRVLAVNQCAIAATPAAVGLLVEAFGAYSSAWAALSALVVLALVVGHVLLAWPRDGAFHP